MQDSIAQLASAGERLLDVRPQLGADQLVCPQTEVPADVLTVRSRLLARGWMELAG